MANMDKTREFPEEDMGSPSEDDSIFEDEGAAEEDFASMLEESLRLPQSFSRGERVKGRVVGMNDEWVFVDLGAKGEGLVAAAEVTAPDRQRSVTVGDWLDAYYLGET
ncbi:MAG TPA: hypothetical protein DCE18_19825, partial [Syntrophobacteraceae bacterium]|nr:hypothetical protein [Syntrophobacteraceae bacterium]